MKPRLSIVVPYRNRESHLRNFTGHVQAYFSRDKWDKDVPYRVLVVEQAAGLPFNAGVLKNIGFLLTKDESDYTCFHDVDYLPVWADYSAPKTATVILHYGAEERPLEPGRSDAVIEQDMSLYFSGAVLIPNAQVVQVNGFAMDYWGWGYEDTDFRRRFEKEGIAIERRKGTFEPLEHQSRGFGGDGQDTPIARVNKQLYDIKWELHGGNMGSGLSSTGFEVLGRKPLPTNPRERGALWEIVTVRPSGEPRAEQKAAANPADFV